MYQIPYSGAAIPLIGHAPKSLLITKFGDSNGAVCLPQFDFNFCILRLHDDRVALVPASEENDSPETIFEFATFDDLSAFLELSL